MFCRKISPDFKLMNKLLFINDNIRAFNISLLFNNFESAQFYSNKIYINDILLNEEKCNIKMNKVTCLIKENFMNEKNFSEDIYIKIDNNKKIQKINKIYYILSNMNNKLYLQFLSKEKYFIKILNQQIESFDNLSKFEIENFVNPIKINIYNYKNKNKIGKIKEEINLNYTRFLENTIGCGIIGESIEIKLSNKILTKNINNVILINSNENSYSLIYKIYKNILTLFIPNNINKGYYRLVIKSNKEILYSQDFKLHLKLLVKEKSLRISNYNTNEPLILNNLTEVDDMQEFYFGKKDEKPQKIIKTLNSYDNTIIFSNSKILLYNFSITDPLSLYFFYAKNICKDDLYILVPIYINSEIIKSSIQGLRFNKSTIIQYILNGTYGLNSIEGGLLKKKNDKTIIYKFDLNNIKYIDKSNNNYTINITFDLTGITNLDDGIYELYFLNFGEYILQKEIIYIIKCNPPLFLNNNHTKCISCIEQNKYYSYKNKKCVDKCNNNEYYYDSICYIKCPVNTYKYGKECINNCEYYENEDLKESNGECINKTFILNNISPRILFAEAEQIFNLTFEENISNNQLFNININNIKAKCDRINIKIFVCKIDLRSIISNSTQFKVNYSIKQKNNYTLNLNSDNISIIINPNSDICDKFSQIYNINLRKCEDCKKGTYYFNKSCINNCKDNNYYVYKNNSKLICIKKCDYKIEHRNIDNYCVKSCTHSKGYGYLNNSDNYNCYKCRKLTPNLTIKEGICVFGIYISKYNHLRNLTPYIDCPNENISRIPFNKFTEKEFCECWGYDYYYNSTSKKCINCPELNRNKIIINNTCVCNPSKYITGKNNQCEECQPRYIPKNGKCECDYSKYGDSTYGNEKCIKCSSLSVGMVLYNGKCICDSSEYIYNHSTQKCIKCSSLSVGLVPYNGKCVCDSGYEEDNRYNYIKCINCSTLSMVEINGKCECENGTHQINFNGKKTCSSDPCNTYNPCYNGICDFINNSYVCICDNGYFGKYCNSSSVETAFFYFYDDLKSIISYEKIISNHTLINLIKQISLYILSNRYISNYFYTSLSNIRDLTISIINDFNNDNYSVDDDFKINIIEYIGLTLFYQNISSLGLDEKKILTSQKIHLFYKKLFSEDYSSKLIKNKIISSVNNMFDYIIWDFKKNSYEEYISIMEKLNLSYINKIENNNVDIILHTVVNSSLDKISNEITTSLYDKNKYEINENVIFIISYNLLSKMNYKYYFDYLSKGINIYNINDKAFTDECYRNKEFKYDLTNHYRKKFIYHHIDSSCIRLKIEDNIKIYFLCNKDVSFSYKISNDSSKLKLKDKTRNLSFKCLSKINEIMENLAFWIYSFLTLIIIIVSVLLLILKSDYKKGEDIEKNDEFNNMICITQTEKSADEKSNIITPIYSPKSLFKSFKFNISHFHPIICLFYRSFLSPLFFNICILIFNISNLFGLNALFYNEKLIEKKIFNENRDSFMYPLLNDYIIIILSVVTSMILTFLIKIINLISFNKKIQIAQCFNKQNEKIKIFERSQFKKRIVAEIIIMIFFFIMFICSFGFCYIYYHTQRTWFYAGIWSLIFIWILIAPLFIFILSIFEVISYNEKIIYYMKRLICF